MAKSINNLFNILTLSLCVLSCNSVRVNFPGCDRAGWKCIKVQASPIRYLLEYYCPNREGITLSLWNFNAPAEIRDLKISNCSSVEFDLTCTAVGRQVESLHIQNVDILNFTNLLYKDMAQMPEKLRIENVKLMPLIPEKTFKQMISPSGALYRCAVNTKPLDTIRFSNVSIGTISQNAFFNLTGMKEFVLDHVTIEKLEALAVQISMQMDKEFIVTNSSFGKFDYKSFELRGPKILFQENQFKHFASNAIDSTSFDFKFINNTVSKIDSFAFKLLSQNVSFLSNNFDALKTNALQGIGPGLLENAFMSFGQLKFVYQFENNKIQHSDIGGIHPDWIAYKNVRSYLQITSNLLPCSCRELGWILLRAGLGDEFSEMMGFYSKFLLQTNKNLCLNTPCTLPVSILTKIGPKQGKCGQYSIENLCQKFRFNLTAVKSNPNFLEVQNEEQSNNFDDIDSIFDLSQKTEDTYSDKKVNKYKYLTNVPKETYFKFEKNDFHSEPTEEIIEPQMAEINSTESPQLYFGENGTLSQTETSGNLDSTIKNETIQESNTDLGKKEFLDEQKHFVKNAYEKWLQGKNKKMLYFKLYGQLMTADGD